MSLTPHQAKLMLFVQRYIDQHKGVSPSYTEMTTFCGLASKSGVNRMLNSLEKRGFISRFPGLARAITVLKRVPDPHSSPDAAREAYKAALKSIAGGEGIYGTQAHEYKETARKVLERFP